MASNKRTLPSDDIDLRKRARGPPSLPSLLARLPVAILWLIGKSLASHEAVRLGSACSSLQADMSRDVMGFEVRRYVPLVSVLDPDRGWQRRPGVVGHFTWFRITSLVEFARLPPNTLRVLFGDFFNGTLEGLAAPPLLTHLTLGHNFKQSVEQLQLPHLTHFTIGYEFSQPIEKLQLPRLTHLTIRSEFRHPVDKLQLPCLTNLVIGSFRQSVETNGQVHTLLARYALHVKRFSLLRAKGSDWR